MGYSGILNLNAVTQVDNAELSATLAKYAVGTLVKHWPAANGIENSNYFVNTECDGKRQEFVLTLLEQPPNAGPGYVKMMHTLASRGLPVAPPIADQDGQSLNLAESKPTMLQPRLSGQHVYNPTAQHVSALARFVARMHLAIQDAQLVLPDYPRTEHWLSEKAADVSDYLCFNNQKLLQAAIQQATSLLKRGDVAKLPRGMIHADLFRDNVLYNEYGLAGVLDFHHASTGFWLFDLAVIANDWCTDGTGQLDPERTLALLRAYHKIRPLTDAELWFFSAFSLYAGLAFWLSRLSVWVDQVRHTPAATRHKNPDEFQRIVASHLRQSFYLDPRQLRDY